jgi:hypothetical protein
MLVFSTQLCELLPPLTFSLVRLRPPSQSQSTVYRQCVAGRGLGSVDLLRDHFLQEFQHAVSDQIQNQCADPPPSCKPLTAGRNHRNHLNM